MNIVRSGGLAIDPTLLEHLRPLGVKQEGKWQLLTCLALPHVLSQDLREKNWKAMEALSSAEKACEEKLRSLTQAKVRTHLILGPLSHTCVIQQNTNTQAQIVCSNCHI